MMRPCKRERANHMSELQFTIPTLFGLEGICADEVRRLNLPQVKAENGRVLCTGSEQDLPRLNLNIRTGEREIGRAHV